MFDSIGDALRLLRAAVSELDPARLPGLEAARLTEAFTEVERLGAAGRTLLARRVEESRVWQREGHRTAAEWIAAKTGTPLGHAIGTLETARRLQELPATKEAFCSGRLSEAQTREIASAAYADPNAEMSLLHTAHTHTVAGLREECRRVRAAAVPDESMRYEAIRRGRYLRHWSEPDGAVRLDARLTPDDGAQVIAVIDARKDRIFTEARRSGRREPFEAFAADALVELAREDGGGSVSGPRAMIHVLADHRALVRGHAEEGERCEIPGIGSIPATAARALASDSIVKVVVTDGVDVRAVAHAGRTIPAPLRTALEARDQVCVVPGCDTRKGLQLDLACPVRRRRIHHSGQPRPHLQLASPPEDPLRLPTRRRAGRLDVAHARPSGGLVEERRATSAARLKRPRSTMTPTKRSRHPRATSVAGLTRGEQLFELRRRRFDTPGFRGIEFIEAEAKSIINHVPGTFLPFNWTINPYRGCSHSCSYCFARVTHTYMDMNAGRDFETKIVVKVNAPEVLRRQLASRRWKGEHIAMGTATDPYQRAEGRYRLMPQIIRALTDYRNPFSILTKGTLILRDLPLLAEASKVAEVSTAFSVGTLDEEAWRHSEPGTPHPRARIEAVAALNDAGVPCGVMVAPILPGITDDRRKLHAVIRAAIDAGATHVTPILLHLRPGVREEYMVWLADTYPELLPRYEEMYRASPYASAVERKRTSRRVGMLVGEAGGIKPRPGTARRFVRNDDGGGVTGPAGPGPARQLSLL